ncbi:hypothetical protein [Blattabacterium sp. (Cryptocercus punctulatus) str. Cpu]|uniref:hypothetical protein n=1 Tax=Blattabacterium sp. (Cryptocercus punctulatus) str. Cpu TaxID=1075399 RepID=UPI0011D1ADE8|nr:hypothetical protein [Blattabacterium sp. (Cryptocercus punctulatus) str. Cpu]
MNHTIHKEQLINTNRNTIQYSTYFIYMIMEKYRYNISKIKKAFSSGKNLKINDACIKKTQI